MTADNMDHPLFWKGTVWICPNCHEVYENARRNAQPCLQGLLGKLDDERPQNVRHHYRDGTPLSLNDQWFWASLIEANRIADWLEGIGL